MSNNVYTLRPDNLPTETVQCLAELLTHAKRRRVNGIAFIAYVEGYGFIANAAGEAYDNVTLTRGMLLALIEKLAKRVDGGRL